MKTNSLPKTRFILALLGLVGSLALARSSDAAPMVFTLTGVSFNDGSSATGSFIFNPSNQTYGPFNIITSSSLSHSGSIYSPDMGTAANYLSSPDAFIFDNFSVDFHNLVLAFFGHITAPGVYPLEPGVPSGQGSFSWSGEFVDSALDYRLITGGFLAVTGVPETGGTLLSLMISIIALFGFHSLQRHRVPGRLATARPYCSDYPPSNQVRPRRAVKCC